MKSLVFHIKSGDGQHALGFIYTPRPIAILPRVLWRAFAYDAGRDHAFLDWFTALAWITKPQA